MKNLSAVLLVLVVGCGGVDDSTLLRDLSVAEAEETCLDLTDEFPARTITCSGQTVTVGITESDCDDPEPTSESCEATVGDARACYRDTAALTEAQVCAGMIFAASCGELIEC